MSRIGNGPRGPKSSTKRPSASKSSVSAQFPRADRGAQGDAGEQQRRSGDGPFRLGDLPVELVQHTLRMVGLSTPTSDATQALGRLQQVSKAVRDEVLADREVMNFYRAQQAQSSYEEAHVVPETNRQLAQVVRDSYLSFVAQHPVEGRFAEPRNVAEIAVQDVEWLHPELIARLRRAKHFDISGMLNPRQMQKVAPLIEPLLGELHSVTHLSLSGFVDVQRALELLPAHALGKLVHLDLTNHVSGNIRHLSLASLGRFVTAAKEACQEAGIASLPLRQLKLGYLADTTMAVPLDASALSFLAALPQLEALSICVPARTSVAGEGELFEAELVDRLRRLPALTRLELTGFVSPRLLGALYEELGPRLTELRVRLSSYRLETPIDLRTMPKLVALELRGGVASRAWLDGLHLEGCPGLESLTLEIPSLPGGLDFSQLPLAQWTKLSELRASDVADTTASYAALAALPQLKVLRLQSGKLPADASAALSSLARLPALERLEFGALFHIEDEQLAELVAQAGPTLAHFTFPRPAFAERVEAELAARQQQGLPVGRVSQSGFTWDHNEVDVRGSIHPMRSRDAAELPATRALIDELELR